MRGAKVVRGLVALALAALVVSGCSSGGSDSPGSTTTTTKASTATTTTAAGTATTTAPAKTTTTVAKTTTTDPSVDPVTGLKPGDECSPEEGSPDCIDPDGDGTSTYLIAGNDCMASAPDPALCEDLDGDGYAGYPDSQ